MTPTTRREAFAALARANNGWTALGNLDANTSRHIDALIKLGFIERFASHFGDAVRLTSKGHQYRELILALEGKY